MIEILKATTSDTKMLTEISTETFDDDSRRFFDRDRGGPPGYNDATIQQSYIEQGNYYKLCINGEVIGGLFLNKQSDRHMELSNIYIKPEHQNKGYGQMAIKEMEKAFPEISKWTLDTPSVCVRNHHLYEKLGYNKVGDMMLDQKSGLKLYFYEKHE